MKQKLFLLLACCLMSIGIAVAQTTVKGTVTQSTDDEPVIGATVLVKGTTTGAITDIDGNFVINNVPADAKSLQISYIGMRTVEVAIAPTVNVVLDPETSVLDDVIVVAYGTAKKSSLTGAITSVNAEKIEARPVSSVTSALEGTTSGVQVNSTYGQPGSDPGIRIRGIGTVNGSSTPLYVIDGVPFGGNISDINPNDIESISILKDAASAALYGNRASNGVILITTKRGSKDKLNIDLKINQGSYTRGIKEYKLTNARQFMEAYWQNLKNQRMTDKNEDAGTAGAYASAHLIEDILYLNIFDKADDALFNSDGTMVADAKIKSGYADDLDWYDAAIRRGYRQEYALTGSSATDKTNMFFSIGYLDEEGYAKNSDFNRFSGRASISFNPKKWLKGNFSLNGTHQVTNSTNGDSSSSYTNIFMYARQIAPIYPVHLHNPETGEYALDAFGNKQYDSGFYTAEDGTITSTRNQYADRHVVWENELDMNKTYRNTLQGTASVDILFLNDFTFTVKGDMNTRNSENQTYNSAVIGDGKGNGGRAKRVHYRYKNYTFQQQLTWNHKFGNHFIDVLLGHENYQWDRSYQYGYKTTEVLPGGTNMTNFTNITSLEGYDDAYRTESYLGRLRYNYKDRYNLETSFRRDGSSRFHKDSRWGNFGSVGLNWIISQEEFMKDFDWVTNMKLRANWGQVGNDAGAGYYSYMNLSEAEQNAHNGAFFISQLANKNLKWETGESWDFAVEGRLFDRWNFTVEYFIKNNKDLLFDVYNPLSAGATTTSDPESVITMNLGTIKNSGVEVETDVDVFRNKDWKVNVGLNASFIKNKITKLPEQNKDGIISSYYNILEGHSRYEFYTYHFAGIDKLTGNSLYDADLEKNYIKLEDGTIVGNEKGTDITDNVTTINGKHYVNNYTYGKRDFRGSALPKVYGSFNASVSWKSLSLSTIFTYSIGGKTFDAVYRGLMTTSTSVSNLHSDIMNSWKAAPEGMTENDPNRIDPNGIPQINSATSTNNNYISDRWLIKSDYLVLKNLSLSWRLPKSWVNAVDLQGVSVNVNCENLFTITARQGMNPQQTFNGYQYNYLVTPRVFSFGLNIKF